MIAEQIRPYAAKCWPRLAVSMSIKTSRPFIKSSTIGLKKRAVMVAVNRRMFQNSPDFARALNSSSDKNRYFRLDFAGARGDAWCTKLRKQTPRFAGAHRPEWFFPAPDGAESTKRIPLRVNRLLKVLDLSRIFFELGFANHDAWKWRRRSLSRERIQFAKNFLGDELERAADRFVVTAKMMRELREMASTRVSSSDTSIDREEVTSLIKRSSSPEIAIPAFECVQAVRPDTFSRRRYAIRGFP